MAPDYSKLLAEPVYVHHVVGNIMFSGKLIAASANFGCFMTMGMSGASPVGIPDNFRVGALLCCCPGGDLPLLADKLFVY